MAVTEQQFPNFAKSEEACRWRENRTEILHSSASSPNLLHLELMKQIILTWHLTPNGAADSWSLKYFWFNLFRFNFQFSINLWSHDRKFDVYIKLYSIYSASFWKYEYLNVINVYGIKPRIWLLYISIEERGGVKQHPVYPSLSRLHGITLVTTPNTSNITSMWLLPWK